MPALDFLTTYQKTVLHALGKIDRPVNGAELRKEGGIDVAVHRPLMALEFAGYVEQDPAVSGRYAITPAGRKWLDASKPAK